MKEFFINLIDTDTLVLIALAILALIDPSMRDAVGGGQLIKGKCLNNAVIF